MNQKCKVPKEDHLKIYSRIQHGDTLRSVAEEYGVVASSISRICFDVQKKAKTAEFHAKRPQF